MKFRIMPSLSNLPPAGRRPWAGRCHFPPGKRGLVLAVVWMLPALLCGGTPWPTSCRGETLPRAIFVAPAPQPAKSRTARTPGTPAGSAHAVTATPGRPAGTPHASMRAAESGKGKGKGKGKGTSGGESGIAEAEFSAAADDSPAGTLQLSPEFQTLLTGLVRENLPDKVEDTKKWGQTEKLTVGLKIRRDGLRITTRRKREEVNHGSWEMYRLTLADRDEDFELRVEQMRKGEDGRLEFDFTAYARLKAFGRWSRWQRGVQLVSLSADANARVRLRAHCRVAVRLDPTRLPPDVVIEPEVTRADIRVLDFRLNQLSDVRGPLARPLGRALEKVVDEKLEDKRKQLPDKINRQIDKHRDHLRFSLRDVLRSPWAGLAGIGPVFDAGDAGDASNGQEDAASR